MTVALRGQAIAIEVPLTQGRIAIVDVEDFPLIAGYRWCFQGTELGLTDGYAATKSKTGRKTYMHRVILGARAGEQVDHVNGDGLDNRRRNLRIATPSQNGANRCGPLCPQSSYYKGVCFDRRGIWEAYIHAGRKRSLGFFREEKDAARAYDLAARAEWGHFAQLNFPDEPVDPADIDVARLVAQRCAYAGNEPGLWKKDGDGRCRRHTISPDGLCWAHRGST